ncbi:MAG TPA: hypothetical protein VD838_18395, partial [Anaeromyxobacteraceae bacterium]|nr:hypothetical protein [Anaeromyxobacteraceae bacterium]
MVPIVPSLVLAILALQAPPASSEVDQGVRPSTGSGRTEDGPPRAQERTEDGPAQAQAPAPAGRDGAEQEKLDDAVESLRAELAGSQERIAALEAR